MKLSKPDKLSPGDLVKHVLYSQDEWIGLVIEIDGNPDPLTRKGKGLVHMLPGVKYEHYFQFKYRRDKKYNNSRIGWISINWLRKIS